MTRRIAQAWLSAAGILLGVAFLLVTAIGSSDPAAVNGGGSAAPGVGPGAPGPSGSGSAEGDLPYHPDPDSIDRNFRGYLWPTEASRRITSSFAEYRSTHFHGGIDISTNGTVGHPVVAVQEGWVYRIRITPNGYGKMLYVRHPDGYISTYAHLQGFNEAITALARAEQRRTGSYEIDLRFDAPLHRVRRGEVIARSGDTGFGPAHLHFEIRDSLLNPVNPLLGLPFRTDDDIPPTIHRFMARPLAAGSTVDGGDDPKIWSRIARNRGVYRIPGKIRLHGEIGFSVEARDRSNGAGGITGIHSIEFLIDGKRIFRSTLNAVPVLKTKQISLHYDLPMIREGRGKFQKLYVEPGNGLPLYDGAPGSRGIVRTADLPEGDREFLVRCTDIHGNETSLAGTITVLHPPAIALASVDDRSVTLLNRSGADLAEVSLRARRRADAGWSEHSFPVGRLAAAGDTIVVPQRTDGYDLLSARARTSKGSWSEPLFHPLRIAGGPAGTLSVAHRVIGDDLRITISAAGVITGVPAVVVTEGERAAPVRMSATGPGSWSGNHRLAARNAAPRTISADAEVNGRPASTIETLRLYSLPHDRAGAFTIPGEDFTVSWDSGAVFRPLHFTVRRTTEDGIPVYLFEPDDVLLDGGIRVAIPADTAGRGVPGLYHRGSQGWTLLESAEGSVPGRISGTLASTLGPVAVRFDATAPTVGLLRVRVPSGKPSISFRYHDNLSGVDLRRLRMTIDGEVVVPEIDGERRRVSYAGTEPLKRGSHLLRIVLRDRAGNESATKRRFTVR